MVTTTSSQEDLKWSQLQIHKNTQRIASAGSQKDSKWSQLPQNDSKWSEQDSPDPRKLDRAHVMG